MSTADFPANQALASFLFKGAHGRDLDHAGHSVQFYADEAFLLDGLSRFMGTSLAAGGGAIAITTKAHRDGLSHRLMALGVDLARALQEGRYIALDAAETLSKILLNGWPDAARFADILGCTMAQAAAAALGDQPRVTAFGEMVALLWNEGKVDAAIRLEELWNELAETHTFSLRCAYPMAQFNREEHGHSFAKICAAHSRVIPGESYAMLAGEDDRLRSIAYLQQRAQALCTEIAERKLIEEELRRNKADLESLVEHRTRALRQLSARLLTLQDSERRRIARELHDSLGQYLVGLKLNVDMLRQSPEREELWSESEELMQQCISEVRTLSYLLHPPTMDAAGLASAAQWFIEGFSQRSGITVTLTASEDLARLPDTIELTLFRALQETLTNVHRHSGSSTADIRIRRSGGAVVLEVADHGCGIKQSLLSRFRETGGGMGVGLSGMYERIRDLGGHLHVDSDLSGTAVRVVIPVTSDGGAGTPRT